MDLRVEGFATGRNGPMGRRLGYDSMFGFRFCYGRRFGFGRRFDFGRRFGFGCMFGYGRRIMGLRVEQLKNVNAVLSVLTE
ncbi:hypothetical protein F2Q70_00021131 [Brassica cretica]|uniref:Uncharacterized protein n=1 Tax=Brassica cretica TaxID=69181 RepID=A0A8S9GSF2_BRACR|nr:hypothetical protein F2Q70_00021131 [Brassica cretica]